MIAVVNFPKWLDREESEKYLAGIKEEVRFFDDYEELLSPGEEVEIIIDFGGGDAKVIRALPGLKWISALTAGVDKYPMETLQQKGILLTNTSGLHGTNIAEHVLGSMVAFSRNFVQAAANQFQGLWKPYPVGELFGRNLLIIGTGRIGREIARKAKAFDMNVYGVRSQERDEVIDNFDAVYPTKDLLSILPGKDYVVLVVPATESTLNLMGKAEFDAMDKAAVFINVGRGDTMIEEDLIAALQKGELRGASLDVFEKEPLDEASPLWTLPNVIITPHVAGSTPLYGKRAMDMFLENLERFRKGEPLQNLVDFQRKY